MKSFLQRLLTLHDSAHGIAGGFALGFGLSLVPIPIVGMLLALSLAPILKLNPTATYLGTAIVNPLTASAFYFAELWIGTWMTDTPMPDWHELRSLEARDWTALAVDFAAPFFLGGAAVAAGALGVVYPTMWSVVRLVQAHLARKATKSRISDLGS